MQKVSLPLATFSLSPINALRVLGEDQAAIVVGEIGKREEGVEFGGGIPHGGVAAEEDAVGTVAVDQFRNARGDLVGGHERHGGRAVHPKVRDAGELFGGVFPDRPSPEVRADDA